MGILLKVNTKPDYLILLNNGGISAFHVIEGFFVLLGEPNCNATRTFENVP